MCSWVPPFITAPAGKGAVVGALRVGQGSGRPFFARLVGRLVHGGVRLAVWPLGGVEQEHQYVGEEDLQLGHRLGQGQGLTQHHTTAYNVLLSKSPP